MNFITKIFGKKKLKKVQITLNLEQVLEKNGLSEEEILRFKIVRLETFLLKAKANLKLFLKPPKIKIKRKK